MATEALTPADRIKKTFDDLESEKVLINACTSEWKTLSDHFAALSTALSDRSEALDTKIKSLDSETEEAIGGLGLREAAIPDRESAASTLIETKKEAAVKELEDPEPKAPSTKAEFLRWYCRRMDASGLWRFMIAHRKDLSLLRKEISDAISESVDACRLVVDAIDDFLNKGESAESGGDRCWAIGMLLRALFDPEGRKGPEVSQKIRERAAEVASEWKKRSGGKVEGEAKGEGEGGTEMGGAETQVFLQMVVAFGLSSKFEEEELRKLVLEHASRKEMPKLVTELGFGEKVADIIDELVKAGKDLEAVCFACESGLTAKFAPSPLLKNILHSSRKKAQLIAKNGNHSPAAIEESSNLEMNAIRSLIKCVENYKLESKFSVEGLKKRLASMEKAKNERKKTAAATKVQTKRARPSAGGAPSFRPSKAVRAGSTATIAAPFHQPPVPHQLPLARHSYNYPVPGSVLDGAGAAAYSSAHAHSPGTIRQGYYGATSVGGYDYAAPQPQYPH